MGRNRLNAPMRQEENLQDLLDKNFGRQNIGALEMPPYFATALNPAMRLRPYQKSCFQYFFTYWEKMFEGKEALPHLLFHMATGSGKTFVMAGLMLYLYEKGYRNFLFFVGLGNIVEKTKENFLNPASSKYLFAPQIRMGERMVEIRRVDNFQDSNPDCINLCLTTIQGLYSALNTPRENAMTYDDFKDCSVVLISDEAHHLNASTKRKGKKWKGGTKESGLGGFEDAVDWETTALKIFRMPHSDRLPNVWLEFTATENLQDPGIAAKYENKIIFNYPLKNFRLDGFSKDIEVVQRDFQPVERAVQAIVLSQYKRKLFVSIGQNIKPVVLLKSRLKKDNKDYYELFVKTVSHLRVEDLQKIRSNAKGDVAAAFSFFDERGISPDDLLLELKEDFREDKLLLVDENEISPKKQVWLNTLESPDNEFRAIFAVDMLTEGWDVLNLFDIVRLDETRDGRAGKPGRYTMKEAQLIGRGARYMPFSVPGTGLPAGKRKFDSDLQNRLRVLEKLHYHSAQDSRYVQELREALVETGAVESHARELHLYLKEEFKQTELYRKGYVFVNKREPLGRNEDASLGKELLSYTYKVWLMSGTMSTDLIFDAVGKDKEVSWSYVSIRMGDLGKHVVRAALNRFESYKFSVLSKKLPCLASIEEFIGSEAYLAGLHIDVYSSTARNGLTQKEKLRVAMEVLRQIEPRLAKRGEMFRGSLQFVPKDVRRVFNDHVLRVSLDESGDQERGRSMRESLKKELVMDLGGGEWYAYNDCFGTSEEKYLIKYIESLYPRLREKYQEIYLVRNEEEPELRLYDFNTGSVCKPDYVLFMRRVSGSGKFESIQIFIEPKGSHLRADDAWKEVFLKEIKSKAVLRFTPGTGDFEIWGMPFYTESRRAEFDRAFQVIYL